MFQHHLIGSRTLWVACKSHLRGKQNIRRRHPRFENGFRKTWVFTARWGSICSYEGRVFGVLRYFCGVENTREEWIRTAWLIGESAVNRLAASRVAVFGLGGVGSFCVEGLARVGIGGLLLVDRDVFDKSNINRQLPALADTVGLSKAGVMAERVARINPDAEVTHLAKAYTPENGHLFFDPKPDYVVDAMDDVPAKVDLIKRALNLGIPVVSSMGAGNRMDPTRFRVADIFATHGCPLARVVRRKLREEGFEQGVKAVFSDEPPARAVPGPSPASISFVPPVAGFILVSVVVKDLIGR